jgi:hypothetical protein
MTYYNIHKDAFSSGQVGSKIWACEQLELLGWSSKLTHVYGGWYGVLPFLLLSRQKFQVAQIRSFDIDPECEKVADMLNENWVFAHWKFKAFTADCNNSVDGDPDLIINTSTEHFTSLDWFTKIPSGARVLLQGNNMDHSDHFVHSSCLDEFVNHYPLSTVSYQGELDFVYPDWKFTRFMVIGTK